MANLKYNRGRAWEYKVKKDAESIGYFVIRSAGSHTLVDLVMIKKGEIVFVQCKTGKGAMTKKEQKEFKDFAEKYGAGTLYARKVGRKEIYTTL